MEQLQKRKRGHTLEQALVSSSSSRSTGYARAIERVALLAPAQTHTPSPPNTIAQGSAALQQWLSTHDVLTKTCGLCCKKLGASNKSTLWAERVAMLAHAASLAMPPPAPPGARQGSAPQPTCRRAWSPASARGRRQTLGSAQQAAGKAVCWVAPEPYAERVLGLEGEGGEGCWEHWGGQPRLKT